MNATVHELPARPVATVAPDRYMSRLQLAEHLGVSTKTVDRMVAEGCPSHTFGRRLRRFRLREVEDWLEIRNDGSTRIGPAPPKRPGPGTRRCSPDARAA